MTKTYTKSSPRKSIENRRKWSVSQMAQVQDERRAGQEWCNAGIYTTFQYVNKYMEQRHFPHLQNTFTTNYKISCWSYIPAALDNMLASVLFSL